MFPRNRVSGGVLVAFLLIAGRSAHAAETPVSLLVTPKAGRVAHVKTVIKANVAGADLVITQMEKDTLKTVKANGDFVVETAYESSVFTSDGKEQKQDLPPPATTVYDKFGKVKEGKKGDQGGFIKAEVTKLLELLNAFVLPEKPVAPNDTWQTELPNPVITDKPITIKDTYLGAENIGGTDCWKIKQSADPVVDLNSTLLHYEATKWINSKTGEMVKFEANLKNVPTQAGAMTMQITANPVAADSSKKPTK